MEAFATSLQAPRRWLRYAVAFVYWALRHRSFSMARWIAAYEAA